MSESARAVVLKACHDTCRCASLARPGNSRLHTSSWRRPCSGEPRAVVVRGTCASIATFFLTLWSGECARGMRAHSVDGNLGGVTGKRKCRAAHWCRVWVASGAPCRRRDSAQPGTRCSTARRRPEGHQRDPPSCGCVASSSELGCPPERWLASIDSKSLHNNGSPHCFRLMRLCLAQTVRTAQPAAHANTDIAQTSPAIAT